MPKHHYFVHVALQNLEINPRCNQTYIDESFVGRIADVYKGSLDGQWHDVVQKNVANKWLMGLLANWATRESEPQFYLPAYIYK